MPASGYLEMPPPVTTRGPLEIPEAGDFPFDLGLDVEWWLSGPGAPVVAGLDEIADLLAELRVDPRHGQPGELLLDVDRCFPSPRAARVARLEHLADLLVALAERRRRAGTRPPRALAGHQQVDLAELLQRRSLEQDDN